MATITSTQSGNFEDTSTWAGGAVPTDGDDFVIAASHQVIIANGQSVSQPTNGFHDSKISGTLKMIGLNATNHAILKMNGRLYIKGGGTLWNRPFSSILFKGATNDTHGLFHENEAYANWIAEGNDGMISTSLTAAYDAGTHVFGVDNTTKFKPGEWISVFDNSGKGKRSNHDWHVHYCDEGFWIHDIANDNIFVKNFVGPEDVTISATGGTNGTTLTLSNAKKFSVGQKVIFGTGNNRNVSSISATDYSKNQVTIADNLVGTISAGTGIFYTGSEKHHVDESKVRKVAAVTLAASNAGTNTITISHPMLFEAGDEIWIEARSECGASAGVADTDDINESTYNAVHTISSIDLSGAPNYEITLSSNLPYNVVEGALVTRLTRDIVVGAQTLGTDKPYYYLEHTSSYSRKFILKDVYFRGVGNSNHNIYSGVTFRGYASTNDGADGDGGDKDSND